MLVCLPFVLRRAAAAHADRLAVEVEDERDRRDRARREREQQAGPLEAHVVEHLVHEERDHRATLGAQERLRGHRASCVAAVRVDDVRVRGDVDHDHRNAEERAGNADR